MQRGGRLRPGEADAHLATALTDYPALNAHVHAGPLRALSELVGVEGTRDGIRIAPRLPSETFRVRWPRLAIRSSPAAVEGEIGMAAPFALEVLVPSGLAGRALAVTVNDERVAATLADGIVRFAVPGGRAAWRVAGG